MSDMEWSELERAAGAQVTRSHEPTPGTLWFSTRGRISRSTYWMKFWLPIVALQIVGSFVDSAVGVAPNQGGVGPFALLATLALLYPGIVGCVKRLHDLNHPGWYVAVYYGGLVGMGVVMAIAVPIFGLGALVLMIPGAFLFLGALWFSLKMGFVRGTDGPNRYGRDPLCERWQRRRA
jgi:uncharacterized membrane protein YhaH (DUF805 family)